MQLEAYNRASRFVHHVLQVRWELLVVKEIPLTFENCRNIKKVDGGSLPLQYNRLNVLFGSNGTGKTTVSKVLDYWCNPDETAKLDALRSYIFMQSQNAADAPKVSTGKNKRPILIFNSEWVENHCFHDDGNLHAGAYRLYVSSPGVRKLERERKSLLSKLNAVLSGEDVENVRKLADTAVKGIGISSRGKIGSAFKDSAPLEGLPVALSRVAMGMKDQDKTQWIGWHVRGAQHAMNAGRACPYCGNSTPDIQSYIDFDNMHAAKQGDAWASVVSVFAEGKLFRITVNRKALKLMSGMKQLDNGEKQWVLNIVQRAKALSDCISNARDTVSSFGENSSDQFFANLKACLVTLEDESGFADDVRSAMRKIASAIRRVIANESKIRSLVIDLEKRAAANAMTYKVEIDFMLEKCGYPYSIEIASNCSSQESKVILSPTTTGNPLVAQPKRALSYGEQNTLALILFMFEAIASRDSCLIVLDDPISSFDGDKRFALLYRMFHNFAKDKTCADRKSLAWRTVVLLTHDYLVVSDVLTILGNKVLRPHVLHLSCGKNGALSHREVGAEAVRPYIQMIRRRIKDSASRDAFFQLVYLRCYCEMMRRSKHDKKTSEGCAFVVISLLVDDYDWDRALEEMHWDGGPERPYVLITGESFIRRYISGFDFEASFRALRDDSEICRLYASKGISPYEKLQVLRLLIRQAKIDDRGPILVRYANEVYHLAGDYLLQLDPVDFNPVPPFVLDWCAESFDDFVTALREKKQPEPLRT